MTDHSLERLHTSLQPTQVSDLKQLEDLLARFVARAVTLACMEPVSLQARDSAGSLRIEGWVCYPAQLTALQSIVASIPLGGIELAVQVLPMVESALLNPRSSGPLQEKVPKIGDFRLGDVPGLFCSCHRPAVGHAQPDEASEVVHVWSLWDAIRPLHQDNGWILCQTANGYLGWVADKDLMVERTPALVPVENPPHSLWSTQFQRMLTETALEYLGESYLWGGTGAGGIDCSGFTAAVYERRGLVLPRDAHQQMLGGKIVATHDIRLPLRTGDLLFFTHEDGRLGHVGFSLGEGKVIHAQEPQVCIFSMNPGDSDHDAYRFRHFVMAKRYLL